MKHKVACTATQLPSESACLALLIVYNLWKRSSSILVICEGKRIGIRVGNGVSLLVWRRQAVLNAKMPTLGGGTSVLESAVDAAAAEAASLVLRFANVLSFLVSFAILIQI